MTVTVNLDIELKLTGMSRILITLLVGIKATLYMQNNNFSYSR